MQDRSPPARRSLLRRTAGPYIRVRNRSTRRVCVKSANPSIVLHNDKQRTQYEQKRWSFSDACDLPVLDCRHQANAMNSANTLTSAAANSLAKRTQNPVLVALSVAHRSAIRAAAEPGRPHSRAALVHA